VEYLQDDGRSKHGPMLTLEQEWYEEYRPRIILQENTDAINSEYIFKDMGCGEPLKKI
jgi:prophage tail gpP-like protein